LKLAIFIINLPLCSCVILILIKILSSKGLFTSKNADFAIFQNLEHFFVEQNWSRQYTTIEVGIIGNEI